MAGGTVTEETTGTISDLARTITSLPLHLRRPYVEWLIEKLRETTDDLPESVAEAAVEHFVTLLLTETRRQDGGDCTRIAPTVGYCGHA
jgi:hypothetical protein